MLGVIIPYYNCRKTIEKTLYSLCNQTKENFIVIMVDDCSTDPINDIIDNFRDKLRIKDIKFSQNKGPGHARQAGIRVAHQMHLEYITFVDSDDILYPRALDILYYEAKQHEDADLIISAIQHETKGGIGTVIPADRAMTWCHGKLYRTKYLIDNDISFSEKIRYNEDCYFNGLHIYYTKNIYYVNEVTYLWRDNKNSVTRELTHNFGYNHYNEYIYGQIELLERILKDGKSNRNCVANLAKLYSGYGFLYSREDFGKLKERVYNILVQIKELKYLENKKALSYFANYCNSCILIEDKIYAAPFTITNWLDEISDGRIKFENFINF